MPNAILVPIVSVDQEVVKPLSTLLIRLKYFRKPWLESLQCTLKFFGTIFKQTTQKSLVYCQKQQTSACIFERFNPEQATTNHLLAILSKSILHVLISISFCIEVKINSEMLLTPQQLQFKPKVRNIKPNAAFLIDQCNK